MSGMLGRCANSPHRVFGQQEVERRSPLDHLARRSRGSRTPARISGKPCRAVSIDDMNQRSHGAARSAVAQEAGVGGLR
jgi:hypothetical protein